MNNTWDTLDRFAHLYWRWVEKCKEFKYYWRWFDRFGPQHQFTNWQNERLKNINYGKIFYKKCKKERKLNLDSYDLKCRRNENEKNSTINELFN